MRVVIKVGTSLIAPGGQIDANLLRAMVDQFDLSQNEYLIVTSGAIAAGMSGLGLRQRPKGVEGMQACAAVGQSKLMHTYERLFFGKKVVAQLLLSSDDFTSPVRYRNLQNWPSCSRWAWYLSSMKTTASRCASWSELLAITMS